MQRREFIVRSTQGLIAAGAAAAAGCYPNCRPAPASLPRGFGLALPTPSDRAEAAAIPLTAECRGAAQAKLDMNGLPDVRDQGSLDTCTAFAMTVLNECSRRRRGENDDLSQWHLYWQCRQAVHCPACGEIALRDAARVLEDWGQCAAVTAPYPLECVPGLNGGNELVAVREAAPRALPTKALNPQDYCGFRHAIDADHPVAIGLSDFPFSTDEEFFRTGRLEHRNAERRGRPHAVCLIGYGQESDRQLFVYRNSWGPSFGRDCMLDNAKVPGQGNGVVSEEYLSAHGVAAYVEPLSDKETQKLKLIIGHQPVDRRP